MSLPIYRNATARPRSDAEASPLQTVRERCERAALARDALAVRRERTDAADIKAASDKLMADTIEIPDGGLAAPVRGAPRR